MTSRHLNWLPPLAAAAALHAAVASTWLVAREPPPALVETGGEGIELSLALDSDSAGEPAADAAPAAEPPPPAPRPAPQPRPQPAAKPAPAPTPAPPETVATASPPAATAVTPAAGPMSAAGDATTAHTAPGAAARTADASRTGGAERGAGGNAKTRFSGKTARDVRGYLGQIAAWIDANKDYPVECKKAREQGAVVVKFTIDRDGRLLASSIKQSSGHLRLDQAALATLARAAPFPPIPDFVGRETLSVAVPIDYTLITD